MEETLSHEQRLARIKREADYPFTILVINRINRRLVKPFARLGINPNAVTWASFCVGLLGAGALYFAAQGLLVFAIAAPLLVFVSHVLDALDGDLARYTGRLSKYGAALDPCLDRACEFALIFAIAAGLWTATNDPLCWVLGSAAIGGDLVYYYMTDAQMSQLMGTTVQDSRRHMLTFGGQTETKVKLGLYEPVKYILALGPSLGLGLETLAVVATACWLAWSVQLLKLFRVTRSSQPPEPQAEDVELNQQPTNEP